MILKAYRDGSQDLFSEPIRCYGMILMCHAALLGGLSAQKVAMSRRAVQDLAATGNLESLRY
jgi:hypothetical protein